MSYKFSKINDTNKKDLKLIDKKDLFNLKLYFVSRNKNLKVLKPRIPESVLPKEFENQNIKRVCFAPSIAQCLQAVNEAEDYKIMYVYVPKHSLANYKIYKCSMHEVCDTDLTDEYWCLNDIEVELIYQLRIDKQAFSGTYKYGYPINYSITKTNSNSKVDDNILEDFALCNEIKYIEKGNNDFHSWLKFETPLKAKKFYTLCMENMASGCLELIYNTVYFKYNSDYVEERSK